MINSEEFSRLPEDCQNFFALLGGGVFKAARIDLFGDEQTIKKLTEMTEAWTSISSDRRIVFGRRKTSPLDDFAGVHHNYYATYNFVEEEYEFLVMEAVPDEVFGEREELFEVCHKRKHFPTLDGLIEYIQQEGEEL